MGWLARDPERRLDPRAIDEQVRSIVSVGMSYFEAPDVAPAAGAPPDTCAIASRPSSVTSDTSAADAPPASATGSPASSVTPACPTPPTGRIARYGAAASTVRSPAASTPTGRIARYARGADYHNVMGRRLRQLLGHLRETEPGLDGRWYVDTGPVMDRAWAARSGIGWWGKHTNIVSRRHGSWLLLGTILLNRDLEYEDEAPSGDFCGTCHRCIDVCPTRAITAERELDARLCISYLTIEHRGPIPRELRAAIGDWIFGCDLCLEVCPWNRFAEMSRKARAPSGGTAIPPLASSFHPREDRAAPALIPLLDLTDEAFRRKFNGSPIQRAHRDGFVRNVAIALGNVGGPESIEPLVRAMTHDPAPLVRGHAAWALGRLAVRLRDTDAAVAARARSALQLVTDSDPFVSEEIEAARQAIGATTLR